MARLRSPAIRAPKTLDEAQALANRFAELDGEVATIEEERRSSHATIDAVADAAALPMISEQKDIAKRLKPWFATRCDELTGGKRKSIEIGGCVLGYRISPPKLHYSGGTDKVAVEICFEPLKDLDLVRTKHELDKPAILKALDGEAAEQLLELGFSAKQSEQFFIDRIGARPDGAVVEEGE